MSSRLKLILAGTWFPAAARCVSPQSPHGATCAPAILDRKREFSSQ